jgi:putative ABC transport system permease protein
VRQVEGLRAVPARVRHEHRVRDVVVIGIPRGATLRRLVARDGREVAVPPEGVVMTATLAEVLRLRPGDRPSVELREGARPVVRPVVAGLVDEAVGLQVYAREDLLARLEGDLGAVGSALLTVDPAHAGGLDARLRTLPRVLDVSAIRVEVQRLRDMQVEIEEVRAVICVALAAIVIFGVVYNNARISLATRARELGSLRVLGFSTREIAGILIGAMAVELAIAAPIGLWMGHGWARLLMRMADQEQFRWEVVVPPSTDLLAVGVAVLASAASALWVRRSVGGLDLVGVLKTRE